MKTVFAAAAGTAAVTFVLLASAPSASADNLQLRVGAFFPRAGSNLFSDDSSLYRTDRPLEKSDWIGGTAGMEYSRTLQPNVEIGFHVDAYGRTLDTSYNDYVRQSGDEIFQSLTLSEVPVGVTLRFVGGRRHAPIRPYIGVGADVIFWEYKEEGSFVRFSDGTIFDDEVFKSDGASFGGHVAGGLRVALSSDVGMSAEGRYLFAGKPSMGGDFGGQGLKLDLSGASATVGFYVNF